jgi:hypothetical protein
VVYRGEDVIESVDRDSTFTGEGQTERFRYPGTGDPAGKAPDAAVGGQTEANR